MWDGISRERGKEKPIICGYHPYGCLAAAQLQHTHHIPQNASFCEQRENLGNKQCGSNWAFSVRTEISTRKQNQSVSSYIIQTVQKYKNYEIEQKLIKLN